MKKKYYAIRTAMTFEKTILVPVDSVKDLYEAIDLVDCGVETSSIMLLTEQADCVTETAGFVDRDGIAELSDDEAKYYQIVEGDGDGDIDKEFGYCSDILGWGY